MPEPTVPLFRLAMHPDDRAAADAVLASGWLTSGPRVAEFETRFGDALGVAPERVVALASATAGLHLGLRLADVGPGDEVIVPALGFVAAANVVVALGATPVFADIASLREPNLDPASVAALIGPRTQALVVLHYAGIPARMPELLELARRRGLWVVEDSAHACITTTPAGACGTLGDAGAFSFFSNKNLGVGEGGALVLADPDHAARARRLRSHGMTTSTLTRHRGHAHSYDVPEPGLNYRWDELRAALALSRLARLPAELAERRRLAQRMSTALSQRCPQLTLLAGTDGEVPLHVFPVLLPPGCARGALMDRLRAAGIQTSIHYPLMPELGAYRGRARGSWPRAAEFCARALTLPFFPALRDDELERVLAALEGALA